MDPVDHLRAAQAHLDKAHDTTDDEVAIAFAHTWIDVAKSLREIASSLDRIALERASNTKARTMSDKVRAFVLDALAARYGAHCRFCGSDKDLTPDHINFDDTDLRWDNLQILCHSCNSAKHRTAKTLQAIGTNGAHSSQLIPQLGTQGGINEGGEGGGGRQWTEVEEVHRQAEGAEGQKETYLSISYRRRFRECLAARPRII